MKRNNTNIQFEISTFVKKSYQDYLNNIKNPDISIRTKIDKYLKFYQYIVRQFFVKNSTDVGTNGILLYHTLGGGKTLSSLVIILSLVCDVELRIVSKRKVILITPHSVVPEFKDNLKTLLMAIGKNSTELINEFFNNLIFISFDAYNSYKQFVTKTKKSGETVSSFENSVIIVDEAHNFFKSIIRTQGGDSASNAKKMYTAIQNTKNKDIIFMTGTPCSKTPFELMPCMNMLTGCELIPENYKLFEELFIEHTPEFRIKNEEFLMNRLFGLVSYVPEITGDNVPKKIPTKIVKTEMSEDHYKYYLIERKNEIMEKKKSFKRKTNEFGLTKAINGTYNVKSRQASIYYNPTRSYKLLSQDNTDISTDFFDAEHAPKVNKILKIAESKPGKVLVYSQFVDLNGLWVVEKFLQNLGYTRLEYSGSTGSTGSAGSAGSTGIEKFEGGVVDDLQSNVVDNSQSKHYIIFSGEIPQKTREFYKTEFNSKKNINGEYIKYILVSKTGAEGLTLKCVKQVHILEPYWDMSRVNQIIGRAIRIGSHNDLPLEERNVESYIHIAAPNKKVQKTFKFTKDLAESVIEGDIIKDSVVELMSIDEQLYKFATDSEKINTQFRNILKRVAIECELQHKLNTTLDYECYKCSPNNKILFTESIENDIDNPMGNPCTSESVMYTSADKLFILDDIEYTYIKNDKSIYGYTFYKKNEDEYVEILDNSSIIPKLMECIKQLIN